MDADEGGAREQIIIDLTEAIQAKWPQAIVNIFGSFPTGLSTFLSDIDVSILGMGIDDPNGLALESMMATVTQPESAEEEGEAVSWEINTHGVADASGLIDLTGDSDSDGLEDSSVDSESEEPLMKRQRGDSDTIGVDFSFNTTTVIEDDDDSDDTQDEGAVGGPPSRGEMAEKQKRQTVLLKALFSHLRVMDWMEEGEFRSKAKVPIIYITHRSGIGCDISMGVTAQDTTELVKALKSIDGDAFVVLSAFLKTFLFLLALDKPYTGGIGSYKLYVMLGFILDMRRRQAPAEKDYGLLLLRFLRYFGSRANLNNTTTLKVFDATASFDKSMLVEQCQLAFQKAYSVLMENIQGSSNATSILGSILDTQFLFLKRTLCRKKCLRSPLTTDADRHKVAQRILTEMQMNSQSLMNVSLETIKRINPCLSARLRSYTVASDAFKRKREHTPTPAHAPVSRVSSSKVKSQGRTDFLLQTARLPETSSLSNNRKRKVMVRQLAAKLAAGKASNEELLQLQREGKISKNTLGKIHKNAARLDGQKQQPQSQSQKKNNKGGTPAKIGATPPKKP